MSTNHRSGVIRFLGNFRWIAETAIGDAILMSETACPLIVLEWGFDLAAQIFEKRQIANSPLISAILVTKIACPLIIVEWGFDLSTLMHANTRITHSPPRIRDFLGSGPCRSAATSTESPFPLPSFTSCLAFFCCKTRTVSGFLHPHRRNF